MWKCVQVVGIGYGYWLRKWVQVMGMGTGCGNGYRFSNVYVFLERIQVVDMGTCCGKGYRIWYW